MSELPPRIVADEDDARTNPSHPEMAEVPMDDGQYVRYDLDELVAGITDENRHDLIDFGRPVGREVW